MKKIFIAFACLIASASHAQEEAVDTFTLTDISNIVYGSDRSPSWMKQRDSVYPGQQDHYLFQAGDTVWTYSVGQNRWMVATKLCVDLYSRFGRLLRIESVDLTGDTLRPGESQAANAPDSGTVHEDEHPSKPALSRKQWLGIGGIIAFMILGFVLSMREERKNRRAVTLGPPMYPGGITVENAHEIVQQQAAAAFQGEPVEIVRIQHGTLDSQGTRVCVGYADAFRNAYLRHDSGIEALVRVNKEVKLRTLYSLLECGNDVKFQNGGFYSDKIVFTPAKINSEIPLPKKIEQSLTVQPPQPVHEYLDQLKIILTEVQKSGSGIKQTYEYSALGCKTVIISQVLPGGKSFPDETKKS